jgi:hypothetical protein
MDEAAVDRAVGGLGATAQAVEVFKSAMVRLGASGAQRFGAFVRTGEAEHLVPGIDEFFGDGEADESGRTGQEYTHIGVYFG